MNPWFDKLTMSEKHPTSLTQSSVEWSSFSNSGLPGCAEGLRPSAGCVRLSITLITMFFFFLRKGRVEGQIQILDPSTLFQLPQFARPTARLGVESRPSATKEQE